MGTADLNPVQELKEASDLLRDGDVDCGPVTDTLSALLASEAQKLQSQLTAWQNLPEGPERAVEGTYGGVLAVARVVRMPGREPMVDEESEMPTERLLELCKEDWELLLSLKSRALRRAVLLRHRGIAGQHIASVTRIPETTIRREFKRSRADVGTASATQDGPGRCVNTDHGASAINPANTGAGHL